MNWRSVVLAAGQKSSPASHAALEMLCHAYWYPLYAYARRRGFGPEDAKDVTQEFFHQPLASDWISRADRSKGRFRTFLLCGIQNFLANEWQRARRLKRGGGREPIPLDALSAEERYAIEPADVATADKLFERRWALTLLERVLERLQSETAATGATERFEALREVLLGEPAEEGYATLAQTVSRGEELEDELRHLMRVLST